MRKWPRVALGEAIWHRKEFITIDDTENYKLCRVQLHAKGVVLRSRVKGADIRTKKQQVCQSGDFLVAEIDAKMGGFGLVSDDLHGAIVSSHYFLFDVNESCIDRRYLDYFCRTEDFRGQVTAQGTTNYAAIRPSDVLGYKIPLPTLAEQQAIVARLDALADKTRQLTAHLDAIESDADQLLAQHFRSAIATAPYRTMAEVAPLVRREAVIDPEASYPELGIRSFGKGTFHKPAVPGMELGTKRLFRIEDGDLVFSNVFAWEGAIAIAQPEDHGRFGSHRFMTCIVDTSIAMTEFVRYYLLSPEGMEKVSAASPGGAGRNRTLGVEKLANLTVPVPSLHAQRAFTALQASVAALKAKHAAIREANAALIPAMLERLFTRQSE